MSKLIFSEQAWDDFTCWQDQVKKTLKRIFKLLQDIDRNGNNGIGKPEPLKNKLSGYWSRRIDEVNRIVYKISNGEIEIIQ